MNRGKNTSGSGVEVPLDVIRGGNRSTSEMDDQVQEKVEITNQAEFACARPLRLVGVQEDTPLCWSLDGQRLAFVSGNRSIYISSRDKDGNFLIDNVLTGHIYKVSCLLFHPKDPILVSGGIEGIFIWDCKTGKLLKKIESSSDDQNSHEGAIECLTWLYDGSSLLSGSRDTNIKVWDATDGKYSPLETINGHKATVLCFSFCQNDNLLATAGRDSTIKLWDVSTLDISFREKRLDDGAIKVIQHSNLDGHRGDVTTLIFSKDGKTLYSGARDNEIKVWDVTTSTELRSIKGHKGDIRNLFLLQNDSLLLSAATDGTVKLWELAHQKVVVDTGNLNDILSQTSIIAEESAEKDRVVNTLQAHDFDIISMSVNLAMPTMATASSSNCVRLWDIRDLANPKLLYEFVGHQQAISSVILINDDSKVLSASLDYNIFLYDIRTQRREASWNFEGSAQIVRVTPDESLAIVGGSHYEIKGYYLKQGAPETYREVVRFAGHSGKVVSLAISPDGSLMASGGHDFNLLLWELKTPYKRENEMDEVTIVKPSSRVDAHRGHITGLAFSEKGDYLVTCSTDHGIILWGVSGKKLKKIWEIPNAHGSVVSSVCFGRKETANLIVSCSWDGTLKVWSVESSKHGVPVKTLGGHRARMTDVRVTADGKQLITSAADCTLRLWSLVEPFGCVVDYVAPVTEGAFTCLDCGDKMFVSGSENGMLRVWPLYSVPEYQPLFSKRNK